MKFWRKDTGQIITIDPSSAMEGGEGTVYKIQQHSQLVAKINHDLSKVNEPKLSAMLSYPPKDPMRKKKHISIAWPIDLLLNGHGETRGFLMPYVSNAEKIFNFYNPGTRSKKHTFINYLCLLRIANNLSSAMGAVHDFGYVIGDVSESNILVTNDTLVTLIDTDSFQVCDPVNKLVYRCEVGRPEYTAPELQGKSFRSLNRNVEQDLFGLGVLIFQLLMEGVHPFAGKYRGGGDVPPYEQRITEGHFVYGKKKHVPYDPSPISPPFYMLHPNLQVLFLRCFENGHKDPTMRPDTQMWQKALKEAESTVKKCSLNEQHYFGKHLNYCPWCERKNLLCFDSFPSTRNVSSGPYQRPSSSPTGPILRPRPAHAPLVHSVHSRGPAAPVGLAPKAVYIIPNLSSVPAASKLVPINVRLVRPLSKIVSLNKLMKGATKLHSTIKILKSFNILRFPSIYLNQATVKLHSPKKVKCENCQPHYDSIDEVLFKLKKFLFFNQSEF